MHLQTSQPVGNQSPLSYAFIATTISWTRPTYQPCLDTIIEIILTSFNTNFPKDEKTYTAGHMPTVVCTQPAATALTDIMATTMCHLADCTSKSWCYTPTVLKCSFTFPYSLLMHLQINTELIHLSTQCFHNSLHLCQLALSVSCTLSSFCMRGIYEMICLSRCVKPAGCFIFCEWRVEICRPPIQCSHTLISHKMITNYNHTKCV